MRGGGEDSWICTNGSWVQHGHPRAAKPIVPCPKKVTSMSLTSTEFMDGADLPAKYSCNGTSASPPFTIMGVPAAAKSLALVLEDPDAPNGVYTHLLTWNIDPKTKDVQQDQIPSGAVMGSNSAGNPGLMPPCPLSGTHRYVYTLYALDAMLSLPTGATKKEFDLASAAHKIAATSLMSRYKKP